MGRRGGARAGRGSAALPDRSPAEAADALPTRPGWVVRRVSGAAATKPYTCPHCAQAVRVGEPHVVAWPEHSIAGAVTGDPAELRRHWHTACWRRAGARR